MPPMASAAITTITATTALPETETRIAIQSRRTMIASDRKSLNPSKNRIANALTSAISPTMRFPLPATLLHSSLTAVQIRLPSERFHSILNVAAAVVNASYFASLTGTLAIDHHDLMERSLRCRRSHWQRTAKSEQLSGRESCDHSCVDSTDYSEGTDSTTSSSSTASTILKDCNILRDGGNKGIQIRRWRSAMQVGVSNADSSEPIRSKLPS